VKIKIEAIIYVRFYEELRNKFCSDVESPFKREQKEIWDTTDKKSKENIAQKMFEISNAYYFERKYNEDAKQHIEVGYPLYPITISRKQMILALKYILFGKDFELIGEFPEFTIEKYQSFDWAEKYNALIKIFKEQYFPNGVEPEKLPIEIGKEEKEKIFLEVVNSHYDVFSSPSIKKIITDYIEALNSKKYHDAWLMLSPDFQNESCWNGSFSRFKDYYKGIKTCNFNYECDSQCKFQEINCKIVFNESGIIWENQVLYKFLQRPNSGVLKDFNQEIANYSQRVLKKQRLGWISEAPKKFSDLDETDFNDYNFQKFFSMFYVLSESKPWQTKEYESHFIADVSIIFTEGKWLIDKIISKTFKLQMRGLG
jgi:hypothetical protein